MISQHPGFTMTLDFPKFMRALKYASKVKNGGQPNSINAQSTNSFSNQNNPAMKSQQNQMQYPMPNTASGSRMQPTMAQNPMRQSTMQYPANGQNMAMNKGMMSPMRGVTNQNQWSGNTASMVGNGRPQVQNGQNAMRMGNQDNMQQELEVRLF